jgi:hypothetical protein
MVKVGFTGTQDGMTYNQHNAVRKWLVDNKPEEAHHGDCIGSDAEFHDMCFELGIRIVIHPPINPSKRAFKRGAMEKPSKPYLERNDDIIDDTDMVLATPKGRTEELRSGTWATIRHAKKKGKNVVIMWP